MLIKEKIKKVVMKYPLMLSLYRATFGKIKTKIYWGMQIRKLQKDGLDVLKKVDNILIKNHVPYFLDCGTLLGMIRDGGLISYDRDMDMGIYINEGFSYLDLKKIMEKIGFKEEKAFYIDGDIKEVTFSCGLINLDFFKHEEVEGKTISYFFKREIDVDYPTDNAYTIYQMGYKHITGIARKNFSELSLNVPENYVEYLESAYTENWKIPDPNWEPTEHIFVTKISEKYAYKGSIK